MTLLTVSGLAFEVRGRKILDGLNLSLEEGEIHALVGANGTGKTTLAYLIMGCAGYTPGSGEIRFQDRVINNMPLYERARLGITMTWQEPARFEGLAVADYLSLREGIDSDPAECLRRVGLEASLYLDRAVDKTLSGGERKRIELASVLALQPRLALLDEPTSGIDMLSIGEIARVIRSLRTPDTSVLLITHREDVVQEADRASYLCGGKIIATGEPDTIADQYRGRGCVECDGKTCHG